MTRVIDVDSHIYEPTDFMIQADAELGELCKPGEIFSGGFGLLMQDTLSAVPPERNPSLEMVLGPQAKMATMMKNVDARAMQSIMDKTMGGMNVATPGSFYTAEHRLEILNTEGIDIQFANPLMGLAVKGAFRAHGDEIFKRAMSAYNSWTCQLYAGHTDRIIPTAILSLHDIDWAIKELERMRAAGSRTFWFAPYPDSGADISILHPDYDRFWSACEDLGIILNMHAGTMPVFHPGWLNTRDNHRVLNLGAYLNMPTATQMVLSTMALTGIFERHPRVFVVVAETGVSWVPDWLDELDRVLDRREYRAFLPETGLPKKPSEYIREHVAFTPTHYDTTEYFVERMGTECLAFSTDIPDPECTHDAVNHWKKRIGSSVTDEQFTAFLGGTVGRFLDAGA